MCNSNGDRSFSGSIFFLYLRRCELASLLKRALGMISEIFELAVVFPNFMADNPPIVVTTAIHAPTPPPPPGVSPPAPIPARDETKHPPTSAEVASLSQKRYIPTRSPENVPPAPAPPSPKRSSVEENATAFPPLMLTLSFLLSYFSHRKELTASTIHPHPPAQFKTRSHLSHLRM